MSRTQFFLLGALLAVIAAASVSYLVLSERQVAGVGEDASSTPNLTGQALFTDGEYGFSLRYPETDQTDYTFASFYHLPANWSALALPDATGTPIIAIIGYRTKSEHSYPRYFDAEVRIGASTDPKELAACTTLRAENGETALPDTVIGGTTWKAFAFQSAGMMQYVKGVSYRTVHEGVCIALEQIETGSSYRDDPASANDIPDTVLEAKYHALDSVVKTFQFSRP